MPLPFKQCYLSAPMTGYPDHNFHVLDMAAHMLRRAGAEVVNPADNFERDVTKERRDYMLLDVRHVLDCEAMVVLAGWPESQGCNCEVFVAWQTSKPVYAYEEVDGEIKLTPLDPAAPLLPYSTNPPTLTDSVLLDAETLVNGPRRSCYGHPLDDYTKVAGMFNSLFASRLKEPLMAEDIPLVMQLVKLSREVNAPKRDNRVDGAGYWAVRDMILTERVRRSDAA